MRKYVINLLRCAVFIFTVEAEDFFDVVDCFRDAGDAANPFNRCRAAVVGGKGQADILLEGVEESTQIAGTAINIVAGIEWVGNPEVTCGIRH